MEEYLDAFKEEAREHLSEMNTSLLALEKDPKDEEAINAIFRAGHTIKGMAATMGFKKTSELGHKIENVFDLIRQKKQVVEEIIVDVLFEAFDLLQESIETAQVGKEETVDFTDLMKNLEAIEKGNLKDVVLTKKSDSEIHAINEKKKEFADAIQYIKVPMERLDSLLNIAGELVTTKNRLLAGSKECKRGKTIEDLKVLDRLISQLQEDVMQSRMIPVGQVFNRFPRMIRDLSNKEGKEIDFVMIGDDIELDRTVLDKMVDPLVHLLRNSVDHGIESMEERKKAGKGKAKIVLEAKREKNHVIISVSDDGAGVDPEQIKKIGIEKGIITSEEANKMDKYSAYDLMFLAGFSSSKVVTEVSGRGVGLNTVKDVMSQVNGNVIVESEIGKGTKFEMTLPLSVAIINTLIVDVATDQYAIPINSILKTMELLDEDVKSVEGQETMIFRKENIPLLRLTELFEKESDKEEKVVVVESGKRRAALAVNKIIGTQEIIIKPIDSTLNKYKLFTGASVLASGEVILVIDIASLFSKSQEEKFIKDGILNTSTSTNRIMG